jgi:hypothetical protein
MSLTIRCPSLRILPAAEALTAVTMSSSKTAHGPTTWSWRRPVLREGLTPELR